MVTKSKMAYLSPETSVIHLQGTVVFCGSDSSTERFNFDKSNPLDVYQW